MNKKIKNWMANKEQLNTTYTLYLKKKIIQKTPKSLNLVKAHLEKVDHNLQYCHFLLEQNKYIDWVIVGLYYSVYHASLALLANKGYASKDHNATLCFLIKHYSELSYEDFELLEQLVITNEEIIFYADLKKERQDASYSTNINFDLETTKQLRIKSIQFIDKVKLILKEI